MQKALWADQEQIWAATQMDAHFFLHGDGQFVASAVRNTLIRIQMQQVGDEHVQGSGWLTAMIEDGRFYLDVVGSGK